MDRDGIITAAEFDEREKQNREAAAAARLSWQLDLYRSALNLIRNFGGKTLISATGVSECDKAYSLGANRAFEQVADIASDALIKGGDAGPFMRGGEPG